MCMQEWTDKQLIDQWQATKDEAVFRVLDDRHRPRITRYVSHSLSGYFKDFTDDIVQDVFEDLQEAKPGFCRDTSVEAWLIVTAGRRVDDFIRRQHAEKRDVDRSVSLDQLLPGAERYDGDRQENFLHELADNDSPDKLACQNELVVRVRRLLDRLCDSHRQIMSLCIEGHTVESAGEVLGLTPTVAKGRAQRAREALRRMIEEDGLL